MGEKRKGGRTREMGCGRFTGRTMEVAENTRERDEHEHREK